MATRGRVVGPNQVVFDQADFFEADGYTRIAGLTVSDLSLQVYYNNALLGWTLAPGAAVTDARVVSGRIYLSPIAGGPYSIRWRPNALGYWRIVLTYPDGFQIVGQDYDVLDASPPPGGIVSSFIRPGGGNC
jgi:hypothetical protein